MDDDMDPYLERLGVPEILCPIHGSKMLLATVKQSYRDSKGYSDDYKPEIKISLVCPTHRCEMEFKFFGLSVNEEKVKVIKAML